MSQANEVVRAQKVSYLMGVLSAASSQLENALAYIYPTWGLLLEVPEGNRIFRLNEPLTVSKFAENGYICLEHKGLSILSFGHSEHEAVRAFCEDFGALWDNIAQVADASLTPEAKATKRNFLKIVNSVVPE